MFHHIKEMTGMSEYVTSYITIQALQRHDDINVYRSALYQALSYAWAMARAS